MTAINIGYTPTIEGAIGLAAIISVLQNSHIEYSIVDCEEDELSSKLANKEIDIAVPVLSGNSLPGIDLINKIYTNGAVLCRSGIKASDVNAASKVIVAADALSEWEEIREKDPELKAFAFDVESLEELIAKQENGKLEGLFFLPTPCEVLHAKNIVLIPEHGLSRDSAYIAVHKDIAVHLDQLAVDEMSHLLMGNKVVSALMWAIETDHKDPEEAVSLWQRGHLIGR